MPDGLARVEPRTSTSEDGDMGTVTAFDVQVAIPLTADRSLRVHTEAAALAWAKGEVGPNQNQVSITAHTADVQTFALRHFTWEASEVSDSGWRLWRNGQFIGGGDLHALDDSSVVA